MDVQSASLYPELETGNLPDHHVKHCTSCYAPNLQEANWCIECGVSLLEVSKPIKVDQELFSGDRATHLPSSTYVPSCVPSGIPCDIFRDKSSNYKPASLTQTSATTPTRHWETSSLYSWRRQNKMTPERCSHEHKVSSLHDIPLLSYHDERGLSSGCSKTRLKSQSCSKGSWFEGTHMLTCPSEVLLHVFSYLKQSDLLSCMLVCKIFYSIANDRSLWKSISLLKVKNVTSHVLNQVALKCPSHFQIVHCQGGLGVQDVMKFIENVGSYLKSLVVEMSELGPHANDVLLLSAADYCTNLSSISLDWIRLSDVTLVKMIELCKSIKVFCVNHPSLSLSPLQALFHHHHVWLERLNLESTFVTAILAAAGRKVLTNLECFTSLFDTMDASILRRLFCTFPRLKSLQIHCTSHSNVLMVESVWELLRVSLEALHFKLFETNSLDTASCSLLSQMSTLRHLSVDCVGDEQLEALCQGSLCLEILDLSGSLVSDNCFSSIWNGSFCLSLRHFKINNCNGINDAAVKRTVKSFSNSWKGTTIAEDIKILVHRCPRLSTLELHGISFALELKSSLANYGIKLMC